MLWGLDVYRKGEMADKLGMEVVGRGGCAGGLVGWWDGGLVDWFN
jgi:hypothetical protein